MHKQNSDVDLWSAGGGWEEKPSIEREREVRGRGERGWGERRVLVRGGEEIEIIGFTACKPTTVSFTKTVTDFRSPVVLLFPLFCPTSE